MNLERTVLLSIGVSYSFVTASGQRAAVIVHGSGDRSLVVYESDDSEQVLHALDLEEAEARTVAELLGLPLVADRVANVVPGMDGMNAVRIPLPVGSPCAGRALGETRARTRTGASIVAVLRDGQTVMGPAPDFVLQHGDSVVVVGDDPGIAGIRELLITG
ncbi:cation:proton antiporter regulatory subunit [Cryptosporangium minutisporangium]|uniref:Cation:proton antiporter regulatory subunit n=1 Tax=Cryptosporangium minutisporangium TaxID=113569 RepID=A0ABP6SR75_9ACTN